MYIAVCDDDPIFREELRHELYGYLNENHFDPVIEFFDCGETLLSSSRNFDIVFMDYEMKELDGLETAKILRERNPVSTIIFITNFPHIVFDAFEVNTFRFLTKPVDYPKLHEALCDYQRKVHYDYPIALITQGEIRKISSNDIVYIEASGKHCLIRLKEETIDYPKTMAKVKAMLPSYCFCQVHRQCVVNFHYISKITEKIIIFSNGERATIGREYYRLFRESFEYFARSENL